MCCRLFHGEVVSWSSSVFIVGLWVFTVTSSSECHGVVDVVVVVVMMCGVVWMDGRGFFGLGFGVVMLCGREQRLVCGGGWCFK